MAALVNIFFSDYYRIACKNNSSLTNVIFSIYPEKIHLKCDPERDNSIVNIFTKRKPACRETLSILRIGAEIVVCYRDIAPIAGPEKAENRPERQFAPIAGPERAENRPKRQFAPVAGPERAENGPEMIEAIFAEYKNKCLFCFV